MVNKQQKDPIIESIFKGTDVVEEEKTAEKSYERRQERRRNEIAEIAASRKQQSGYKMKTMNKGGQGSSSYVSPFRSYQSPSKAGGETGKHHHHHHDDYDALQKYPPPPVFNSLPPNLEFVHRLIIKCTDSKFMEEKKTKKK